MTRRLSLILRLFLFVSCLPATASDLELQSSFVGPVSLRVWQHWQESWNVEQSPLPIEFELQRGWVTPPGAPAHGEIRLKFLKVGAVKHLKVRFTGTSYVRDGEYGTKHESILPVETVGSPVGEGVVFEVAAPAFVDEPGKRIVTAIEFEIFQGGNRIYHYRVLPMYVRGAKNHYWNNVIDGYSAHAGSGTFSVANGSAGEAGWDKWDGQLVRPSLSFIDRNSLRTGDEIGLHRHVQNQELWLVESGKITVAHGIAARSSGDYTVQRRWMGAGEMRDVIQFDASGGWMEKRTLSAGEYSVIVPDPADKNKVTCHGMVALADSNTFTMGTKN